LKYEAWAANLYVNNVMDKRGVLTEGPSTAVAGATFAQYITPRTVGISLSRTF
jgi:hypothetical protein